MKYLSLLVCALVLSSCGVRDTRYAPRDFPIDVAVVPPDVVLPHGSAADDINGLHVLPPDAPMTQLCCPVDETASFRIRKKRGARMLTLGTWNPPTTEPQQFVVRFADGEMVRMPPMQAGFQTASVVVPRAVAKLSGEIRVTLDSKFAATLISIYFTAS